MENVPTQYWDVSNLVTPGGSKIDAESTEVNVVDALSLARNPPSTSDLESDSGAYQMFGENIDIHQKKLGKLC